MPKSGFAGDKPEKGEYRFTDKEIFDSTMDACMRDSVGNLGKYINTKVEELKKAEGTRFLMLYTHFSAAIAALPKRTYENKEIPESTFKVAVSPVVKNEKEIDRRLGETLSKMRVKGGPAIFKRSMQYLMPQHEDVLGHKTQSPHRPPRTPPKRRRRPL